MKNILLLITGLLILSSCGMMPTPDTDAPDTKNIASTNSSVTTYIADLDAVSGKIKDSEEFRGCMKQNTNMCIQSAGMQLAQKAKDPTFCKELLTSDQRSSCEFAVIMITATEKNNDTICDTITDLSYQKQCKVQVYRQQAISNKDIKLCDKVEAVMKPTGTGILLDTGMQKDQCIMQYIMSGVSSDPEECENLSSTGSLEMCKSMIKNRPTIGNPSSNDNTKLQMVAPTPPSAPAIPK